MREMNKSRPGFKIGPFTTWPSPTRQRGYNLPSPRWCVIYVKIRQKGGPFLGNLEQAIPTFFPLARHDVPRHSRVTTAQLTPCNHFHRPKRLRSGRTCPIRGSGLRVVNAAPCLDIQSQDCIMSGKLKSIALIHSR